MAVNQRPAFFAIQAVVPGMRRLGGGSIINIGSTGWQTKTGGYPAYATAKSSVMGLTRGLARELGEQRHPHQRGVARLGDDRTAAATLWLDEAGEAELARRSSASRTVAAARHRGHGAVPGLGRGAAMHRAGIRRGCRLELTGDVHAGGGTTCG